MTTKKKTKTTNVSNKNKNTNHNNINIHIGNKSKGKRRAIQPKAPVHHSVSVVVQAPAQARPQEDYNQYLRRAPPQAVVAPPQVDIVNVPIAHAVPLAPVTPAVYNRNHNSNLNDRVVKQRVKSNPNPLPLTPENDDFLGFTPNKYGLDEFDFPLIKDKYLSDTDTDRVTNNKPIVKENPYVNPLLGKIKQSRDPYEEKVIPKNVPKLSTIEELYDEELKNVQSAKKKDKDPVFDLYFDKSDTEHKHNELPQKVLEYEQSKANSKPMQVIPSDEEDEVLVKKKKMTKSESLAKAREAKKAKQEGKQKAL